MIKKESDIVTPLRKVLWWFYIALGRSQTPYDAYEALQNMAPAYLSNLNSNIHYDLCPSCSHCVECSAINYSKDWLLLFIQVVDQMFTYKGQFPCTCNVIKLFLPTTVSLYHFNFLHGICNHLIVPWLFIHSVYNLIYLVFLQWWE